MGLRVRELSVRFGAVTAVDDVSFEVPDGTTVAVLGPSGCGKSTLLRALAGLEPTAHGKVCWDGEDLTRVPTHRRGMALMFQDGQLFGGQSVARNIGYPMRIRHLPRKQIAARVGELIDLVGLNVLADRKPEELSGGERQRVALARALAVDPRLLLLDEPMSALDRDLREALAQQLRTIVSSSGTTAVMVTHDQEEAFAVADRIVLMRAGQVVQSGTLAEVWGGPADAWAARFLGYPTVLEGSAALAVRQLAAPHATWTQVALRRSALRVSSTGAIEGVVEEVRATPELLRVRVRTQLVGVVDAVAEPGLATRVGDVVRLAVDPGRLAAVGAHEGNP